MPLLSSREFRNLVLRPWQSKEAWVALAGDAEMSETLACEYFWEKVEDSVQTELDILSKHGWEPVDSVDCHAVQLRKSQFLDFAVNPADLLLWFMTLGVALIVQLYLNTPRRYVRYTPVQVRIRLSRLKERQIATAA